MERLALLVSNEASSAQDLLAPFINQSDAENQPAYADLGRTLDSLSENVRKVTVLKRVCNDPTIDIPDDVRTRITTLIRDHDVAPLVDKVASACSDVPEIGEQASPVRPISSNTADRLQASPQPDDPQTISALQDRVKELESKIDALKGENNVLNASASASEFRRFQLQRQSTLEDALAPGHPDPISLVSTPRKSTLSRATDGSTSGFSVSSSQSHWDSVRARKGFLSQLAGTLGSASKTNELTDSVVQIAIEQTRARRGVLLLINSKGELASTPTPDTPQIRIQPDAGGIPQTVMETGSTFISSDVYNDERITAHALDEAFGDPSRTVLACPVRGKHSVIIGVLVVVDKLSSGDVIIDFDEDDVNLIEEFAVFAGIGVQNHRLLLQTKHSLQEAKRLEKKNEMLLSMAKAINETLDTSQVVRTIMALSRTLVNADRSALFMLDKENDMLYSTWLEGTNQRVQFPSSAGIAGAVCTTGKTENIADAYADDRFNRSVDVSTGYKTKTILCMPIRDSDHNIIAVVQLVNKLDGVFTEADEELFEMFSVFCGISLQNAKLYQDAIEAKSKAENLLRLAQTVGGAIETSSVVKSIMLLGQDLCHAHRSTLFMVDHKNDELYSTWMHGSDAKVHFPKGSGIAGHVATTGTIVNISDAYSDPRFNRRVDIATGYKTKSIMCLPIKNAENEVMAVVQLINKMDGDTEVPTGFSKQDEEMFTAFGVFAGISLNNALLYDKAVQSQRKTRSLLQVAQAMSETLDTSELVSQIMRLGQNLLKAEQCSVFTLDESEDHLVTQKLTDGSEEAKFSVDSGVIGHVMTTGQIVNLIAPREHAEYGAWVVDMDAQLGSSNNTQNMLCVPIRNSHKKVIAVAQATNKIDGAFTQDDEDIFGAFAVFCGLSLHNANLYNVAKMAQRRTAVALELVAHHSSSSDEELREFQQQPGPSEELCIALREFDFPIHLIEPPFLSSVLLQMFIDSGMVSRFKIPVKNLARLLLTMRKNYRDVPYHNFTHAATVTHQMYTYFAQTNLREYVDDLEVFCMLLACLCHDVDHRGTNNAFQVESESPLAQIYNGTSVMENHHVDRSITILSEASHNIFAGLTPTEYGKVFKLLKEAILDTDLAMHFPKKAKVEALLKENAFSLSDRSHLDMLLSLLMTCADISTIAKPFDQAAHWAKIVASEFYAQGDQEKAMGKTPQAMYDREKSNLAEMQEGFIKFIGLPLWRLTSAVLPDLKPQLDHLEFNCAKYTKLKSLHENARQLRTLPVDEGKSNDEGESNGNGEEDTNQATDTSQPPTPQAVAAEPSPTSASSVSKAPASKAAATIDAVTPTSQGSGSPSSGGLTPAGKRTSSTFLSADQLLKEKNAPPPTVSQRHHIHGGTGNNGIVKHKKGMTGGTVALAPAKGARPKFASSKSPNAQHRQTMPAPPPGTITRNGGVTSTASPTSSATPTSVSGSPSAATSPNGTAGTTGNGGTGSNGKGVGRPTPLPRTASRSIMGAAAPSLGHLHLPPVKGGHVNAARKGQKFR